MSLKEQIESIIDTAVLLDGQDEEKFKAAVIEGLVDMMNSGDIDDFKFEPLHSDGLKVTVVKDGVTTEVIDK